jgi:hypothetical protein
MKKIVVLVICMLVGFSIAAHGDTITLRNGGKDIDLKVIGVTEEYINAVVLKKDLKSLNMQFLNTKNYPDQIFLNAENAAVECKIKEITEDAIQVLIPTDRISSLKMSFQPKDKQAKAVSVEAEIKPQTTDVIVGKGKTEQMEEQGPKFKIREDTRESGIVDDIRTSPPGEKTIGGKYYRLRTKKTKAQSADVEGDLSGIKAADMAMGRNESVMDEKIQGTDTEMSELKQKPTDESMDKGVVKVVEVDSKKENLVVQDPNLGRVEGRILSSGKPLEGCQVKLQMLEKGGLITKGYRPVEGAVELETVTDKDGIYRFMNVSPGLYKLYWKPPSEVTWVRRFKMEPDVIVNSGKLTNPKDIETTKRTLN